MKGITDGGPVYPCQITIKERLEGFGGTYHEVERNEKHAGITLRNHFAGLAMQGLIAQGEHSVDEVASLAYGYADAMLKVMAEQTS